MFFSGMFYHLAYSRDLAEAYSHRPHESFQCRPIAYAVLVKQTFLIYNVLFRNTPKIRPVQYRIIHVIMVQKESALTMPMKSNSTI